MIMTIYQRALNVLMKKPLKLWGISLLFMVLSPMLVSLCGVAIPVLGLSVSLLLSTSMTMVYLHGYRGEDVKVVQLFDCFKDMETIKRVVLGLAWMNLWIFLWSLIPIVGPIIALVRTYEYRLTPYILITEPDVSVTEAIKVSSERTNGYKLQMWAAEVLFCVAMVVVGVVLGLLSAIPAIGFLFALILVVVMLVIVALGPLFLGLVQAAFYEEISNPKAPQAPEIPQQSASQAPPQGGAGFCTNCGAPYAEGAAFCTTCGKPRG